MEKRDIIIFAVVISFVAFRLYQKYGKKGTDNTTGDKKISKDGAFYNTSKDDDYEPYSKK